MITDSIFHALLGTIAILGWLLFAQACRAHTLGSKKVPDFVSKGFAITTQDVTYSYSRSCTQCFGCGALLPHEANPVILDWHIGKRDYCPSCGDIEQDRGFDITSTPPPSDSDTDSD